MVSPRLDVAVVGAGVVGLAIARELAGRGARVAVFERAGIGAGASGVQPGGVRQQWGTPIACRLARESAAFYADADERLAARVPLGFRALRLPVPRAHARRRCSGWPRTSRCSTRKASPSRIVSPAEAAELVPGLETATVAGGAWCAEDGYFDRPQAVVEAFGRGLDVRIGEVRALSELEAGAIVVAAGADTPRASARAADRARGPVALLLRSDRASGCSSRSSSRRSAASPRSSSATGACSRATSARAATTPSSARRGARTCAPGSRSCCRR